MSGHRTYPKFYRKPTARSRTGVVGVGFATVRSYGKTASYFTANVGTVRRFNINRLGREEAFRRALKCRAEHELKEVA